MNLSQPNATADRHIQNTKGPESLLQRSFLNHSRLDELSHETEHSIADELQPSKPLNMN
jgi:hypothetical protein